jgi:hypothetical protein
MAQTRKRQKRSLARWLRDSAETFDFIKWWPEIHVAFWSESKAMSETDRNLNAMKVTYICRGSLGEGDADVNGAGV